MLKDALFFRVEFVYSSTVIQYVHRKNKYNCNQRAQFCTYTEKIGMHIPVTATLSHVVYNNKNVFF